MSEHQPDSPDTGLICLLMLARFHNVAASGEQLAHEFTDGQQAFATPQLLLASRKLGLKAKRVETRPERLTQTPLPAIAADRQGGFFIIARMDQGKVLIQDPRAERPEVIDLATLEQRWSGELLLLRSEALAPGESSRFDFTWFIPAIIKHRKLLGEVTLVSFVLQIFALLTPLFFQVVMDKVLVHHGLTTLDVIAIGLLGIMLFESALSGLRSFVFAHTASRIDVELGSRLFHHLLHLPLAYFQARRVGDSVARVRELENIRNFLTGNAITLVMDVLFSVVFIAVMFCYSGWLALVVVASLPLYALVSLLITPVLRQRLQDSFNRGAENQAFLVETVNGIDTLKSMAVEPQVLRRWDNQLAAYVAAGFKTQTLSTLANESVGLIGKLVTVATLWLGAHLVINGQLTVGELIAFNMLAGRVAQPIMRLAQLWTSFQQTSVSVQRLGDILNTRTELASSARSALPPLQGRIEFDQVHFRYRTDGSEILRGINLCIEFGEVIGVVGRSGSGKSTLTRLLQRLYVPERGRVLVDGMDLALADASSLRRQIGVVQQDNLLFNRSIRENIALADPGTPLETVMQAARLAGAHDFILELAEGYDTMVGEHGVSLSGGQRQRIAIARALIRDPRILIFDEATSALDYESERIIQQNMRSICQGRTVIIIAHRLSAVRDANRIVVVDRGQIVEQGSHAELLAHQAGHYARLHRLQQG
ncbi:MULTISPECIES: type I secretion system permease/ATPase [Pseudomonas]|uniref:type I secretion system permease/ATPase n=1 Tax=Pseudomonas TaxID=286 RepID=UPI0015DD2307|nr:MULTISPECIES: type I secretion system permease/ATPase [Pseudomonas]MEB3842030.1 type I secretion system permease/ATPase [Pseudomonas guariconensis]MEB3874898.1 type I secretion system permease/ATPase [Pseudomonas guariconensis]MEB3878949.1 type I secretion system permease/ATPase [Pseudomonas guariconensis]MEB3896943.1 type I secretion system permease/ATPase [Pseudomonas guariconensis]BBR51793.1 peptidase C39 [Pseudomonas putida]